MGGIGGLKLYSSNDLDRMNIFNQDTVDLTNNDTCPDFAEYEEEFASMLYSNPFTSEVVKVYTGLLPLVSGNCDNIVNKLLTFKDVDLTVIGKSFYTNSILNNMPKDPNSKKLYASIMNQLICYNILNSVSKDIYGACTLKIDTTDAPAWFNLEHTCKLLVYILRERKINALTLKRTNDCDLFLETFTTDINKHDEIRSSIDYIKQIVKGDISESRYHSIVIKVTDVINKITKEVFELKMLPMQEKLYDAENHWTNLESIEDEVKYLKYIDDFEDKIKTGITLTEKLLKLTHQILFKLGKCKSTDIPLTSLTDFFGICSVELKGDYNEAIVALENYKNTTLLDLIPEESRQAIEVFLDKDIFKLISESFEILSRYRDTYLFLDMNLHPSEMESIQKEREYEFKDCEKCDGEEPLTSSEEVG